MSEGLGSAGGDASRRIGDQERDAATSHTFVQRYKPGTLMPDLKLTQPEIDARYRLFKALTTFEGI